MTSIERGCKKSDALSLTFEACTNQSAGALIPKNREALVGPKKSTRQSAENERDIPDFIFQFFPLAPRITRAYKGIVSSWSSGGLHESTGLRSARKLSTPLLRCESRTNRLKPDPLVKRRSKRKKRALMEGPLTFSTFKVLRLPLGLLFPA